MILNPYAIVIDAYATLAGQKPGASSYADHKAYINANGQAAYMAALEGIFASVSNASMTTTVLTNLGLSSVFTAAQGEAYFAANASNRVKAALDLASGLANYAGTDTAILAAKTAYNNTTTNAYAYASNSANTADAASSATAVSTGQTLTLTTGSNTFTGGAGDDTFDAGLSTGSLQTLNSGDRLDGGNGTDELYAVINGSVTPASLTSIENVTLTSVTNAATVDLTNATGLESVVNQASTTALTLSGISTDVDVTVRDTAIAGQTVTYSGVTGSADSATINLANVTGAATLTVAGIETLTLNSVGSVTNVLAGLTTAAATTLVVTGDQGANVGTLGTTITSVDASANSGATAGVTLTMGNTASALTVTGGAGNDSLTMGSAAGADVVDGGAGNDTIIYTANFTTADTINGGDGTDTLRAIAADLVTASATTPTTYTVTNVETLRATDALANGASINAVNISTSANRVNLALTGADVADAAGTIVGNAGSFTLGLGGSAAGNTAGQLANASTITVNDTGAATTDSLTILNTAVNSTTGLNIDVYDSSNLVVGGYETVTINSGSAAGSATNALGTVTVTGDVGGTSAETVVFTGKNNVTVGVITADIVDASALTANSGTVLTMVTNSTATTVTGSAGNDVLFGATGTASSVDGGAGNDTMTGGTGNDTLLGGAGNDTITTGGGAGDNVDGGAGNDTVVATLTAGNVMVGGDGTDILSLAVAATAATATGVSGFETLRATAAITSDMAVFLDNNTFTKVEGAVAGTSAFTNVGSGVTTLATTIAANTSSLARLVDTSSNSLNVVLLGNATTDLVTANNEETINLSTSSTAGATIITTLTATDLHTLNITGSNAITIGTLSANSSTAGTTLTIDGSANTGGVSVSAANSTIAGTITGSATAASTLVGTGGADTIIGGSAADTITGGLGADVLTGGVGADTFIFANTASGTPSATVFDTITDFGSASDIIDHATATLVVTNGGTIAAGTAAISADGVATFNIADSTLALRLTAVAAAITETGGASAAGEMAVFQFGSDAYVFISDATNGLSATDNLIKLTGVSVADSAFDTISIVGGNATIG